MSFLSFDLDAKKMVQRAARAAGLDNPGPLVWGLLELWELCWMEKRDIVTLEELAGCFGEHANPKTLSALCTFSFLEAQTDSWRVRGAKRYLRIQDARVEAGKASAARPRNDRGQLLSSKSPASAGDPHQQTTSSTPNTEHRTPIETKEEEAPPSPKASPPARELPPAIGATVTPPDTPPDVWTGPDFEAWAQSIRVKNGLLAERPSNHRKLSAWWSTCLMTEGVTPRALMAGFIEFGQSDHWEHSKPPYPFAAFMAQWTDYTIPEVRREVHA